MTIKQIRDYILIIVGAALQAVGMFFFLIPAKLAAGGLSGAAQIINHFTGWPIGIMVLIGNLPLFIVGWKFLGGRRFLTRTIIASVVFSVILDSLALIAPRTGITPDPVLNVLYGAVLGGIGGGLVIRAQGTSGGTEILARFLSSRFGIPLSQSYMFTDSVVVFLSGLAFSWEHALYALVVLYGWGIVTDFIVEGSAAVRVATIITGEPDAVSRQILTHLERGITGWPGTGMFSGQAKHILFCVVSRGETAQLKELIHEVDPAAFVVIGQAHEALGEGFKTLGEAK